MLGYLKNSWRKQETHFRSWHVLKTHLIFHRAFSANQKTQNPASDPTYIFRIAEAYLIRAEARAQQDKQTDALVDLNAVRDRAGLTALTATTTTKEALLLAIENERRVEFALEPHRWFDVVRTGRAAAVFGLTDANRYILPIPIQQILSDNVLKQNPGY